VARATISPAVVERGKSATAFVNVGDGSGSAFCISKTGIFVTDEHVIAGAKKISLVINPGEANERVLSAKVLRVNTEDDLAILKADGPGPYAALELGITDGLRETMEVVAFGYPFGKELTVGKQTYPNISVNAGRITSLRKDKGKLQQIQLDSVLNPGNSGGPVLNEKGQVIGIVESGIEGTAVNFATPVNLLRALLSPLEIVFDPAPLVSGTVEATRVFRIEVLPFYISSDAAQPFTASLTLSSATTAARVFPGQPGADNIFTFKADLRPFNVQNAKRPMAPDINYLIIVKQGDKVVTERKGVIPVLRAPGSGPQVSTVRAPTMDGDKKVVALPSTIDDLV